MTGSRHWTYQDSYVHSDDQCSGMDTDDEDGDGGGGGDP